MKTDITTLIIGASLNPSRYSNLLMNRLTQKDMPVIGIGIKEHNDGIIKIHTGQPVLNDIHTVSIYLRKELQEEYKDYILSLKPKRIIFNPGAENEEFRHLASSQNIEAIDACSLVMLQTGQY